MEFEYHSPLTHKRTMVCRLARSVSRFPDGMDKPLESAPWQHADDQETERSSSGTYLPLNLYRVKSLPKPRKDELLIRPEDSIPLVTLDSCDIPYPGAPKAACVQLPWCCDESHRTRPWLPASTKTNLRVLAWLKDVEPVYHGPWVSFLPTCESSNGSDMSLDSVHCFPIHTRADPISKPEPTSFAPVMEDWETRDSSSTDDVDTWPYDGRGLYEHHAKHECGLACYFACRRRRVFRTGSFGKVVSKMLPWTPFKRDEPVMLNSDVPHPPWWLSYRSNDDTLGEDEDDGDLELWLEHTTQEQLLDHELRFSLALNQKPDSRIFSSWSE